MSLGFFAQADRTIGTSEEVQTRINVFNKYTVFIEKDHFRSTCQDTTKARKTYLRIYRKI